MSPCLSCPLLMRRLGCVGAMNFDGGTSTTMVVSLKNESGGSVPKLVCGKLPETRVKSVLLVVSAREVVGVSNRSSCAQTKTPSTQLENDSLRLVRSVRAAATFAELRCFEAGHGFGHRHFGDNVRSCRSSESFRLRPWILSSCALASSISVSSSARSLKTVIVLSATSKRPPIHGGGFFSLASGSAGHR